jgi:hypothetical protein
MSSRLKGEIFPVFGEKKISRFARNDKFAIVLTTNAIPCISEREK